MMAKMEVDSVAELVRAAGKVGITVPEDEEQEGGG
jgi:hypothetical protein